jgi:anti-sigma factor RsiW
MHGDRKVGGLWCHEVLARLSDYLDDELAASARNQIEDHLRGCDVCERFGGEFASVIKALRKELTMPDPLDSDLERRLQERLIAAGS